MAICMDYIKSGEVLIAPRLDYKYQFILKCSECEECYCLLEPFVEHCTSHYNRQASIEENLLMEEVVGNEYHVVEIVDGEAAKEESVSNSSDVEFLTDNDDTTLKDYFIEECLDLAELSDGMDKTAWENDKSDNDEVVESKVDDTFKFVENFLTSSENVAALIDAYEDQPKMWNTNLSKHIRKKADRVKFLQKIATELEIQMNLTITAKEAAAVIAYLRQIYRIKLERDKAHVKYEKAQKNAWLFDRLRFLKKFIESHSIKILDSHPYDLVHDEILQLLDIYKKNPNLWDSEIMESCCKNKRAEALDKMINDIKSEMDVEANENTINKYLHNLHVQFSREKRRDMGIVRTKDPKFEYYDHAKFLYNHVGPFKCSTCKRLFQSPLKIKSHKYQHGGIPGLNCPQCKKGFKAVEPYIAHVRRHMNDLGVECKECGRAFLRQADLRLHMRFHTGVKPFCCDVCGVSFRYSQSFSVHKRRHDKQYSHFCDICSKKCYTKNELKNHMRIHRDIREFVCNLCGNAFKTKKTMQQHMFIHEEGRNHICPLCGKTFKNKIGLGHHLKTHSRNKFSRSNLSDNNVN